MGTEMDWYVAECPGCKNYIEQMQLTIDMLHQIARESVFPATKQELLSCFGIGRRVQKLRRQTLIDEGASTKDRTMKSSRMLTDLLNITSNGTNPAFNDFKLYRDLLKVSQDGTRSATERHLSFGVVRLQRMISLNSLLPGPQHLLEWDRPLKREWPNVGY